MKLSIRISSKTESFGFTFDSANATKPTAKSSKTATKRTPKIEPANAPKSATKTRKASTRKTAKSATTATNPAA